jgi:HEAT repeat protein
MSAAMQETHQRQGWTRWVLLLGLIACAACSKAKTTDELLADLNSTHERDRIIAVRLLPDHKADADKVVPALIACLKDDGGDIRLSAAIGLGNFGATAKDAIPALREAERDRDVRVIRAAGVALTRIDPTLTPKPQPVRRRRK